MNHTRPSGLGQSTNGLDWFKRVGTGLAMNLSFIYGFSFTYSIVGYQILSSLLLWETILIFFQYKAVFLKI